MASGPICSYAQGWRIFLTSPAANAHKHKLYGYKNIFARKACKNELLQDTGPRKPINGPSPENPAL